VLRQSKQLHQKYYTQKIEGLRTSDAGRWWSRVKIAAELQKSCTQQLIDLANQLYDGDMQALANHVDVFFQQVAADLHPLAVDADALPSNCFSCEFVIDQAAVERRLSWISIHKAPGPYGLPN
jgi:hypothetical protein